MPRPDLIRYALHKERDAIGRFEIGLGNLTDAEADKVLTLLANLQKQREG
jgi:rubrerythrin